MERLVEPPEVKHERLLVVSILGFLVNLVGIFVFQVWRLVLQKVPSEGS